MATTSTGLSSAGIGSGLDVNSIVSQLVALERRPITALQVSATKLQTQLSAMGQMQSLASALRDAAAALAKGETYTAMGVSSGDSASVGASVSGTTTQPAAGTYAVNVTSLASAQTLASPAGLFTASTDTVGSGTLTLRVGAWNDALTGFTPKTGSSDIAVSIAAGDSLSAIRDKINAAATSAGAGISAALITDSTGVRLTLRSTTTGAENGFRVQVADDDTFNADAAGLSRLAYDPAGAATQLTRTTTAADARATINGIDVRSPTDTLSGVVEGLTIKLAKVTTSPVTLTVAQNSDSIKNLLGKFVSSYNALTKFLGEQTKYDATTKRAGLFQGDGSVVGVQNQLRSQLTAVSYAAPDFQTLSSLGIELQKDGSLLLNATKVDAALAVPGAMQAALAKVTDGQPALTGAAVRMRQWADALLESGGTIPGRNKSLQDRIKANERDQARLEDRVAQVEKRLRAQYSALDTTMSRLNGLNAYVNQQLNAIANTTASISKGNS